MREELVRRNYAQSTMRSYLRIVRDFQTYCGKRLDRLGPDDLRSYHAYLLEARKLAVRTVVQHVAAIRFLYAKTLKRRDMKEDLPYPPELPSTFAGCTQPGRSSAVDRLVAQPVSSGDADDPVLMRTSKSRALPVKSQRYRQ